MNGKPGRIERWSRTGCFAVVCLLATGCRHKTAPILPPTQAQAPVPLAMPPENAKLPQVEPQPLPTMPTIAVKLPKRQRRKAVISATPKPAEPAPPVQVASAEPAPSIAAIGNLTTGDDTTPAKKKDAEELLTNIDKRLKALPSSLTDEQRTQVAQAKNFFTQAEQALHSGDVDGATTLGTKAKLVLDDLAK